MFGLSAGLAGEVLLFALLMGAMEDVFVSTILTLMPVPLVLSFSSRRMEQRN